MPTHLAVVSWPGMPAPCATCPVKFPRTPPRLRPLCPEENAIQTGGLTVSSTRTWPPLAFPLERREGRGHCVPHTFIIGCEHGGRKDNGMDGAATRNHARNRQDGEYPLIPHAIPVFYYLPCAVSLAFPLSPASRTGDSTTLVFASSSTINNMLVWRADEHMASPPVLRIAWQIRGFTQEPPHLAPRGQNIWTTTYLPNLQRTTAGKDHGCWQYRMPPGRSRCAHVSVELPSWSCRHWTFVLPPAALTAPGYHYAHAPSLDLDMVASLANAIDSETDMEDKPSEHALL